MEYMNLHYSQESAINLVGGEELPNIYNLSEFLHYNLLYKSLITSRTFSFPKQLTKDAINLSKQTPNFQPEIRDLKVTRRRQHFEGLSR